METVREIGPRLGIAPTCSALGLPRATYYRRLRPPKPRAPRPLPKQALSPVERQVVLAKLHEDRFIDLAPTEIYAQLLDEGQHLCSIRTMYRVLAANEEVRERRRQRLHVPYTKPELLATAPNQVWSWDITKCSDRRNGRTSTSTSCSTSSAATEAERLATTREKWGE